jgi:hypothetical protein
LIDYVEVTAETLPTDLAQSDLGVDPVVLQTGFEPEQPLNFYD